MESVLGNLVSRVKGWQSLPSESSSQTKVAPKSQRRARPTRSVPSNLDLHYITHQLLAVSEPLHATEPTYNDTGRDGPMLPVASRDVPVDSDEHAVVDHPQSTTTQQLPQTKDTTNNNKKKSQNIHRPRKRPRSKGNSPADLVAFLDRHHSSTKDPPKPSYLLFSLSDDPPDDRTLLLLRRQIVRLPWRNVSSTRGMDATAAPLSQPGVSETPTLRSMLHVCYALSAWLGPVDEHEMEPATNEGGASHDRVAVVYCANGKTRTAIALACFLKFSGQVKRTSDGFCHFLERRCCLGGDSDSVEPRMILKELPASLHSFFRNFDSLVETGRFMNTKPLMLRAIALQGVPVEDKPRLDIWDSWGRHVYSSHALVGQTASHEISEWQRNRVKTNVTDDSTNSMDDSPGSSESSRVLSSPRIQESQWADEEGFYRVNVVLEGDFCLLCRFGGDHADDVADSSKIIFRYVNTTGFLGAGGTYELPRSKVDLMRRYADFFDDEEFLLSLVFESHWSCVDPVEAALLRNLCSEDNLPPILNGFDAMELGWEIISNHHSAKPAACDVQNFLLRFAKDLVECPEHLVSLSLQLNNLNFESSSAALLSGMFSEWWGDEDVFDEDREDQNGSPSLLSTESMVFPPNSVLDILHGSDEFSQLPTSDILLRRQTSSDGEERQLTGAGAIYHVSPLTAPHAQAVTSSFSLGHTPPYYLRQVAPEGGAQPLLPFVERDSFRISSIAPIDDMDNEIATNLLFRMKHPGVDLDDLLDLARSSRRWASSSDSNDRGVNSFTLSTIAEDSSANETTKDKGVAPEVTNIQSSSAVREISSNEADDSIPLREDPKFEKYFRMLSKGIPDGAVRNALSRDGLDPNILDLDPCRSYESQANQSKEEPANSNPPLRDHPKYEKYFRMLSKGLPEGAVRNALTRDGLDPSILDLDPAIPLEQQSPGASADTGESDPALQDDPKYEKYFRMLSKGLPDGAVRNALSRDGLDPSILDLDRTKSLASQKAAGDDREGKDGPPLREDPLYTKYFRMLSKGLPDGAVRNAILRDGLDPSILDLDPEKSLSSQKKAKETPPSSGPKLKDDPKYKKYFLMLSRGLPDGAVRNALLRDGLDPSVLDLDPEKSLASQTPSVGETDTGIALRDDPEWKKYFKMINMGIPIGSVKNAVTRDGKDPSVIDLDPTKSLEFQQPLARRRQSSIRKKKTVRRKKIYWNPIDPKQVKEDSIWSIVKGRVNMRNLKYDVKEFEDLFTESADPAERKKKAAVAVSQKTKKSVQVIDGKRSMNGGIILLRLKLDYKEIARMVDGMSIGGLDSTQLMALKEFLPSDEERKGIIAYLDQAKSEEERKTLYADLSECEKYMYAMIGVENAPQKFDCMLFRVQFRPRLDDILDGVRILETACNEVRSSERLREVIAIILSLVNEINTGGDGNEAIGFSLDALLKLNEAKAFDRKTSVLKYLARLVKSNNPELCGFRNDLLHVRDAEAVLLDSIIAEIKALELDLAKVTETAEHEADKLEESGQTEQVSLRELREQRTSIRSIDRVPQYNQIDHLSGRTSMERFVRNAALAVDGANERAVKVKENYTKVLEYLCEDENMASNDFFGTINKFIAEFGSALEQVEREEKAKIRERNRNAAKESPRVPRREEPGDPSPKAVSPSPAKEKDRVDNVKSTPRTSEKTSSSVSNASDAVVPTTAADEENRDSSCTSTHVPLEVDLNIDNAPIDLAPALSQESPTSAVPPPATIETSDNEENSESVTSDLTTPTSTRNFQSPAEPDESANDCRDSTLTSGAQKSALDGSTDGLVEPDPRKEVDVSGEVSSVVQSISESPVPQESEPIISDSSGENTPIDENGESSEGKQGGYGPTDSDNSETEKAGSIKADDSIKRISGTSQEICFAKADEESGPLNERSSFHLGDIGVDLKSFKPEFCTTTTSGKEEPNETLASVNEDEVHAHNGGASDNQTASPVALSNSSVPPRIEDGSDVPKPSEATKPEESQGAIETIDQNASLN